MKVGHVISMPPFAWAAGGVPKAAFENAKAVAGLGHDVSMITTDLLERNKRYAMKSNPETVEGVSVFRCRYISDWLAWDHKAFISPKLIMHVKEHLRDFDIIHLHDLISPQGAATSILCNSQGMPYVLSPHGSLPWLTQSNPVKKIYSTAFGRSIVRNAKRISALNEMEVGHCRELGVPEDRVGIVPNGLNIKEFDNPPDRGSFRSKHGIEEDDHIILFLGRIHPIKGLDLLLDSFSDVLREDKNARLIIAGPDDGFQPTLQSRAENLGIAERVLFPGPVYGEEKLQALIDSDLFVLPSIYEMYPLTLLEAAACGLPAVITDRCGIANLVGGRFGMVVQYDRSQLGEAISGLLKDDSMRRRFGSNGKQIAAKEFDWKNIAPQIVKLYESALEA